MNPSIACILIAGMLFSSCESHSLIPGFNIGMSEQELNSSKENNLATGAFIKSADNDEFPTFIYHWRILDSTFYTTVAFNNDGVPFGNLRICVIDIKDSAADRVIPEAIDVVMNQISPGEFILPIEKKSTATTTLIDYWTCPEEKFKRVLAYLQSNFGTQDSITYQVNNGTYPFRDDGDTIYTRYNFHDTKSTIVLRREKVRPASELIPYSHIDEVVLYQTSSAYESELAKVIAEKKKVLKPSDIITIRIPYEITKKGDEHDALGQPTIVLTIEIEGRLKTPIETREISSMKGKIFITDAYGDSLQTIDGLEFNTQNALVYDQPGLDYALGGVSRAFHPRTYNMQLNMNDESYSDALKNAVRNGRELKIEFVPDALLFSDGSVLK